MNFKKNTTPLPASITLGGYVASDKTKSVLKHHRRLVKSFPWLIALIFLASISLYSYIFFLRNHIGFNGMSFLFMFFMATIILGVGSVFVITYLGVGLGKMNQELCFVYDLPGDPTDLNYEELDANQYTHLLFLLNLYKSYGRALFYPSWIICIAVGWLNGVLPELQEIPLNNELITVYFVCIIGVLWILRRHKKLIQKDLKKVFAYKPKNSFFEKIFSKST